MVNPPQQRAGRRSASGAGRRLSVRVRRLGPPLVQLAVVALVVLAAAVSGFVDGTNVTLQIMGFDPDRAQLITALLVDAVAAAAATIVVPHPRLAILAGILAGLAVFGETYLHETSAALASHGTAGTFDFVGWLLTDLTLITAVAISAWAGSVLAWDVRPALGLAAAEVKGMARSRRERRGRGRKIPVALPAVVAVALVLAITLPVLGDMLNFAPDTRMLQGGPAQQGLVPANPNATAPPLPSGSPSPLTSARPWLAWVPSGVGAVKTAYLPAPWKEGTRNVEVDVYTPPGYSGQTNLRYPVIYEVPWAPYYWIKGGELTNALNSLIVSGNMPATIVVFSDAFGGPYPDTECANSFDGRQWYDTWFGSTLVPWVDGHYRTIAAAPARAVMGMSQGGYCAAILALHHPDLFGAALSFSGYFWAGSAGSGSARPFGGNAAAIAEGSPAVIAPQLPQQQRSLYFILTAKPAQPVFGRQAVLFDQILNTAGYPNMFFASTLPHGWAEVRSLLPQVLETWASRLASTNAFNLTGGGG